MLSRGGLVVCVDSFQGRAEEWSRNEEWHAKALWWEGEGEACLASKEGHFCSTHHPLPYED